MKLFNDIEFRDFSRTAFERELAQIDFKDTLEIDVPKVAEEISKKLKFTVPFIEQSGIQTELILKNKDGSLSEIPAEKNEADESSAEAVFKIPFSGNVEIFKISPSEKEDKDYDFEIQGKQLICKAPTQSSDYQLDESDQKEVIDRAAEMVSYIEHNLQLLEKEFSQFRQMLPHLITTALNEKKAHAIVARRNEESINSFGKNS